MEDLTKSKKKMFVNIVLDASSSMKVSQKETINGFNEYIDEQKKEDDVDMFVSLTQFNSSFSHVYTACPIADVEPLTENSYAPCGTTALYDAMAASIHHTETSLEREDDAAVLFVVFTDGEENASKEFGSHDGLEKMRKIIKSKQNEGKWTFVFFGTDMDAWQSSSSIGMSASNTMKVARGKTGAMYSALSESTKCRAKNVARGIMMDTDFFASNRNDYNNIDKEEKTDK